MQEVAYRKVLQDDGNKQIVEVDQIGRWRFLMMEGTFSCRVLVEQDRKEHSVGVLLKICVALFQSLVMIVQMIFCLCFADDL